MNIVLDKICIITQQLRKRPHFKIHLCYRDISLSYRHKNMQLTYLVHIYMQPIWNLANSRLKCHSYRAQHTAQNDFLPPSTNFPKFSAQANLYPRVYIYIVNPRVTTKSPNGFRTTLAISKARARNTISAPRVSKNIQNSDPRALTGALCESRPTTLVLSCEIDFEAARRFGGWRRRSCRFPRNAKGNFRDGGIWGLARLSFRLITSGLRCVCVLIFVWIFPRGNVYAVVVGRVLGLQNVLFCSFCGGITNEYEKKGV